MQKPPQPSLCLLSSPAISCPWCQQQNLFAYLFVGHQSPTQGLTNCFAICLRPVHSPDLRNRYRALLSSYTSVPPCTSQIHETLVAENVSLQPPSLQTYP